MEEEFGEKKASMVSIHRCILKPHLLVFYYMIKKNLHRKLCTTSNDCKLNLYVD